MTGSRLPLAATGLAATLTLWCCGRPVAKNRFFQSPPADAGNPKRQEEPRHAREEARRLRAQATPPAAPANGSEILDT